MGDITPEQAQALLDAGHISQNTFDDIVATGKPEQAAPVAAAPPAKTLDVEPATAAEVPEAPKQLQVEPVAEPEAPQPPTPSREIASAAPATAAPSGPVLASDVAAQAAQPDANDLRTAKYRENLDKDYGQIAEGMQAQAKAGIEQGAKVAGQLAGVQATLKDNAKKSAAADILDKSELDDQKAKVEDTIAWAKKQAVVNPERFWNTRTTAQKIEIGIGMFLGVLGSRDGSNAAVKVVQDAINRDVEAQKATAGNAKGIASEQQTLYGKILERVKDRHLADSMTRAAMMDQTRLMIETQAAQYKGQEAGNNARIGLAQLDMQRTELQNKIDQQLYARHMMSGAGNDIAKITYGSESLGMKPEEVFKQYGEYQAHQKLKQDVTDIFHKSAEKATILNKLDPQNAKQLEAEDANFMSKMRVAYGTRWTDAVEKELKSLLPSTLDTSKTTEVKLENVQNMVDSMAPTNTTALDALGIKRKAFKESPRVTSK